MVAAEKDESEPFMLPPAAEAAEQAHEAYDVHGGGKKNRSSKCHYLLRSNR